MGRGNAQTAPIRDAVPAMAATLLRTPFGTARVSSRVSSVEHRIILCLNCGRISESTSYGSCSAQEMEGSPSCKTLPAAADRPTRFGNSIYGASSGRPNPPNTEHSGEETTAYGAPT